MAGCCCRERVARWLLLRGPGRSRAWARARPASSFTVAKLGVTGEKKKEAAATTTALSEQLGRWLAQYEDFVGLTQVRAAQDRVLQAQKMFNDAQEERRGHQQQLLLIQQQLKDIHLELDRTSRGEDRYLQLVTDEHAIIKQEKQLIGEFNLLEKSERERFARMTTAVRESHEKERAHAERTKYWSIIGSICGAVIGIVGTTLNNWLRMRELRGIVFESSNPTKLQSLIADLSETAKTQHNQLTLFVADLKALLGQDDTATLKANVFDGKVVNKAASVLPPTEKLEVQTNEILSLVRRQESNLTSEMKAIKALVVAGRGEGGDGEAVYVGRDVERLVKDAERNLEWKMKISALSIVAAIYGALAIVVPLVFKAFGGT